ncbi:MAG: DNA polymerase III subunit delta [Betaproteobacteria bacterium RIFCSPLOWO2_12_FULL_63_13]|nr:MAG: DNA polymerase III subunit delta [Betaproteobacteria bacterium RIFCSPLOWO2_12_FULL_63_13]
MTQLRLEQLDAHLSRQLASLYVLHGDEPLLSFEAADAIRARARAAGYSERVVLLAERNFKWGELGAAAASMSLFGDRKLIELRIPTGKPGTEGASAIQAFCEAHSEDIFALVSLPRLDRAGQNSAWFAALGRCGVVVNIHPVERPRLPEWIAARLARQKQRADRDTMQYLADSVEGNLLAAHQEIQKLGLLFPQGSLDFDMVRAALMNVARYDPGQLGEAMLAGDRARLARMLEGLRGEGEAAPRILWVLADEIRTLARVQRGIAAGRPLPEVFRECRIWGSARQTLVADAARRIRTDHIEAALAHAAAIDRIIKGVLRGDAWDEMLHLGLRFA